MSKDHAVRDALHEATHRMPGIPEHRDRPEGHQGANPHGRPAQNRPAQNRPAQNRSLQSRGTVAHHGSVAAHTRSPRVLVAWQNRIAALFSRRSG
ncbi:hypothetical protein QT381_03250 [Galbitalea sp. SE-J8]|uniref:hypothetical protein n=1 Tax=Galbitalea sp. SE-J8 TaxID=3054952 RepID=UPI00259D0F81|nr:hypothetical protein [Galbitalea sp. SE-J8]MDM4762018.1 hypothetical protein [Galbitalea sp. SE-J8]